MSELQSCPEKEKMRENNRGSESGALSAIIRRTFKLLVTTTGAFLVLSIAQVDLLRMIDAKSANQFLFAGVAEARPIGGVHRGRAQVGHYPRRHHHHHVHRRAVIVAPIRPIPAVRPWYWGRVAAGVTIGAIIAVSVAATVPPAPSPDLCWSWTDSAKTKGYWSYCVAPAR